MQMTRRQPELRRNGVHSKRLWCTIALVPFLAAWVGCSMQPPRVDAPDIDASEVAQSFIDQYDGDGDSRLSQAELRNCPSLESSLSAYDGNNDRHVSAEEISSRLANIYQDKIAIFQLYATVTLDGRPLAGAEVELTPEPPLTGKVKYASGRTNKRGIAALSMREEDMPTDLRGVVRGVQTGLYRITVRHNGEQLSAISGGSVLGEEITPADGDRGIHLALKS
jgi:hypothetical protein